MTEGGVGAYDIPLQSIKVSVANAGSVLSLLNKFATQYPFGAKQ
jgi:hypothetical protein